MIRGLLYRQIFMVAEGALVVVCALWAGYFAYETFATADRGVSNEDPFRDLAQESFNFAKTGPLGGYSEIINSGIFGAAAKVGAKVEKVDEVKPLTEEITKLPLLLKGTVLAGPLDPFSSATIQHKDLGQISKTYFIGDEVSDQVFLKEVRKYEVILKNQRENKLEHLQMSELYEIAANTPATVPRGGRGARPSPVRAAPRGTTITLNQRDIQQQLIDQYQDIATKVDVREYKDANGKVIGLTSSNISQIELAKDLGLQDNDILTTINNRPIDSSDAILKVLNDFAGAKTFRVGIIRNGKRQNLNYNLQ